MQPYCTVQELMVLDPLRRSAIIGGWAGRENKIVRVVTAVPGAFDTDLANSLVIVRPEIQPSQTEAILVTYLRSAAAGILFAGQATPLFQRILDVAEQCQIPLLGCTDDISEQEVSFALELAVTLIANNKLINFAEYSSIHLLANVRTDVVPLLDDLAHYLQNSTVLVNPVFHTMARSGVERFLDSGELDKLTKLARLQHYQCNKNDALAGKSYQCKIERSSKENINCYVNPLLVEGQILGYLLVFDVANHLNQLDGCRIRETGVFCLQVLIHRKNTEEIEKKYQEQFLYDLLYNNFETEEALIQRARYWNWDFSKPQQILIIEPDELRLLVNKAQILERVRLSIAVFLQDKYRQVIITEQQGQMVVIIAGVGVDGNAAKQHLKNLAKLLQEHVREISPDVTFSVGIGKFYPVVADLCRSYQEAKHALYLGRFIQEKGHITHFEDLGIIRLLSHINLEQLDNYCKEHLAVLIEYDNKNDTNFLEILQVYFQQNGDLNLAAEKLFQHANTLRYRLKKIEDILGVDLQKLENRVNLSVACKIVKMLKTNL